MATLPGKLTHGTRPKDDTELLHRQLDQWTHRDIADEQELIQALRRWPLLAELAEEDMPFDNRHETSV